MTILYLFITGLGSGTFGALLGMGGGIIVVPMLTMLFGLPIHTTIGISLVGVIATSTGAAIANIGQRKANVRLGMLLELGTTIGAIIGAVISGLIGEKILFLLFAAMVMYNAYSMYRKEDVKAHPVEFTEPDESNEDMHSYEIRNIPMGMVLSGVAGVMSGLLGIGGGIIKIPVMYLLMGVPLKEAAATSNFMIGITATASAFVYYLNGNINPVAVVPVALGVFLGANIGSRLNSFISVKTLKRVFIVVFFYIAVQMFIKGLRG